MKSKQRTGVPKQSASEKKKNERHLSTLAYLAVRGSLDANVDTNKMLWQAGGEWFRIMCDADGHVELSAIDPGRVRVDDASVMARMEDRIAKRLDWDFNLSKTRVGLKSGLSVWHKEILKLIVAENRTISEAAEKIFGFAGKLQEERTRERLRDALMQVAHLLRIPGYSG